MATSHSSRLVLGFANILHTNISASTVHKDFLFFNYSNAIIN